MNDAKDISKQPLIGKHFLQIRRIFLYERYPDFPKRRIWEYKNDSN